MSVDEIIQQIRTLGPDDRRRVEAALAALAAEPAPANADPAAYQRGLAAWERLMSGVCEAGGRHLSAGIDDALYGPDR